MPSYIYNAMTKELEFVAGGTLLADMPIGTIVPFGGSTIPNGYRLCDGSEVLKTEYADLYEVIGDSFGTASENTKFVLPDLRETIPVGVGTRGSGVTDHDTYTVGQFKDDQLQNHKHIIYINDDANYPAKSNKNLQADGWDLWNVNPDGAYNLIAGTFKQGRGGTTTHGKQIGVNFIIKAIMTALPADFEDTVEDMIDDALEPITDVIPSTASSSNKLATMADTGISTNDWNTIETII